MASFNDDFKSFRRSWVHHTGMQLATLSVLTATFSVIVFGFALSTNLKRVLASWGDSMKMAVYLEDDLVDADIERIRKELEQIKSIKDVTFIPRETATANFKAQMASYAPDLLEDADFANSFPASFQLSVKGGFATEKDLKHLDQLGAVIQKIPGVEDVSYGQTWVKNYSAFVSALYTSSGVLGIILVCGSLFVVGNSIRASISARREEIEILELVGATSSMIRRPFILEGFVMGALAVFFALILNFGFHLWQKNLMSTSFVLARLAPMVSFLDPFTLIGFVIGGGVLGALGAWLAVRRINDGWSASQALES